MRYPLIILIGLCILLCSCNSEDRKIKNALRNSIEASEIHNYEYQSHLVLETLLSNNISDSISSVKLDNDSINRRISSDSIRLIELMDNIDDCKRQQANTLYFLRSHYSSIIRDYQEMVSDINMQIEEKQNRIAKNDSIIAFWEKYMSQSETPIVFYKVKHTYKINGMCKESVVLLDSKYNFIK